MTATPHGSRLHRDTVTYAARQGGAPASVIASVLGLSTRTVQLAIQAGKSGQLAEQLAQVCAREKATATVRDGFQRDRRRRNRAPGSTPY